MMNSKWFSNMIMISYMISLATAILYVMFGRMMFPSHRSLVTFPHMAKMLWTVHPPPPAPRRNPVGGPPLTQPPAPLTHGKDLSFLTRAGGFGGWKKKHLYRIGCCCLHIKAFINTPLELPHFFVGLAHPFIQLSTVINCRYMPK